MKTGYPVFITTLAIGLLSFQPLAFSAQEADVPPIEGNLQFVNHEEVQTRLLNTLENAEGVAAGIGMSEVFADQIEAARERLLWASPEELDAIPVDLYNSMGIIEVSTGNIRLMYDPALRKANPGTKNPGKTGLEQTGPGMTVQSVGPVYDSRDLDEPVYPTGEFNFTIEKEELDNDDDTESGGESGVCKNPGTSYEDRLVSMNAALIANGVRNVMGQVCGQQWVLANASLACIPFEIVADVFIGLDDNLALCNEHIGAAEGSATWQGLKRVHRNVQHTHDDLEAVDSALATHDTVVRGAITEHDSEIKTQVTAHDTHIDGDLAAHDTNIDGDLASHDTNIDGDLIQHDADLKSQLSSHDATIKAQLATHDADIKARLGDIQATVNENQRLIKVSMVRQAEVLKLLITPEGKRDINSAVLSCSGDDCPSLDEIISCGADNSWPCN